MKKNFNMMMFLICFTFTNLQYFAQSNETQDSLYIYQDTLKFNNQNLNDNLPLPNWHDWITNVPGDILKYFDITFRNNKILMYSAVSLSTAVLIATDSETYEWGDRFHKKNNFNKYFAETFEAFGNGTSQFGLAACFTIYGLIAKDNRAIRTGSQITEAVLASGLVVQVLKHITGRETPMARSTPTGIWRFFPNQIDYHKHIPKYDAFPSGHLTTTVATIEVLAVNYPDTWWIRPIGYSIATGLCFGMVNMGIHWYSDYPMALALGYTFGQIIANPEGINDIFGFDKKTKILPYVLPKGGGISFLMQF